MTLQAGVGGQFGIAVGREHLAVSVDGHTGVFTLLGEHLQVVEIMAGNHDERARLHLHAHRAGHRVTVAAGIGLVEEF